MGMQVRAGRPFNSQDGPKAQPAAIINETVARATSQMRTRSAAGFFLWAGKIQ